jgi:hypothetical protein
MKKQIKRALLFSIMLISSVVANVLSGCSSDNDNEEFQINYPTQEEAASFNIEGCNGVISYDTDFKAWIIRPTYESASSFKHYVSGEENGMIALIENAKSLDNLHEGAIYFSGMAKLSYYKYYEPGSLVIYVYTIQVSDLNYIE